MFYNFYGRKALINLIKNLKATTRKQENMILSQMAEIEEWKIRYRMLDKQYKKAQSNDQAKSECK